MHMHPDRSQPSSGPQIRSFPLAMSLGYILPLMFAAIPASSHISYRAKQQLIALWQGWPLYTTFIMFISHIVSHASHFQYRKLQSAYIFALACSTTGHFWFLWLSWSVNLSHHVYLLPNPNPWGNQQVATLEGGVLRFLQWDYTWSALAMLIWTNSRFLHRVRPQSSQSAIVWVIFLVIGVILIGPCSVAFLLFWKASSLSVERQR